MTRTQDLDYPTIRDVGVAMFSMDGWVLPFEIVSLVLTVALIAAVWWTREARPQDPPPSKEITSKKTYDELRERYAKEDE
jgi:uncharacterized membrane protein